jgi:hypothetical protein
MKQLPMQTTALMLVGLGLLANAAVVWFRPAPGTPMNPEPVLAQSIRSESAPAIFYVGRETFFITSSADGQSTYLWFYHFNPDRRANRIEFMGQAHAPK